MYERTDAFYKNVIKEYFKLSKEDSFISDEVSQDLKDGIEYAIERFGFNGHRNDSFQDILTLRYQRSSTYKEIATLIGRSEAFVSSNLEKFRKQLKYSPYRMYLIRGLKEGQAHEEAVRNLVSKAMSKDKDGYEEYQTDIDRLNVVWLGFFGIGIDSIKRLYDQHADTLGAFHSYSVADWNGSMKDFAKSDVKNMEELFKKLCLFTHFTWRMEK